MRTSVRRRAAVVAVGLLLAVGACEATRQHTQPPPAPTRTAHQGRSPVRPSPHPTLHPTPHPTLHPTPRPSPRPSARPSPAPALRVLDQLPVKGRAPLTGYDRDLFGPAWSDDNNQLWGRNGCDTRNDILRRDLTRIVLDPRTEGCVVLTGVLHDPYGGSIIHFVRGVGTSEAVQIDHVVALADAWVTGAQRWSPMRRQDFANDPLELLAVDGALNSAKGAGDAATWLPPRKAFRCAYVARQIAVKRKWDLWVKPAERDAMTRILQGCPRQRLPSASARP